MPDENEIVIQSKFLQEDLIISNNDKIFFTAGLHPWHANYLSKKEVVEKLKKLIQSNVIVAIGETGIDKLKGPDLETQIEIFKVHVEVAEEFNLPVIIHSVRAHNEILKLKIDLKSNTPWVIHHFNGSKQAAENFLNHGFYLSVCHHIKNDKTKLNEYFKDLPQDKIFLETDDFKIDIKDLYLIAAKKMNVSVQQLKKQLVNNLKNLLNE
jgi:TatD DNase family protein